MITGQEIEQMEAGLKMDTLVAEHVMGWREVREWLRPDGVTGTALVGLSPAGSRFVPHYSRDVAAAWTVVERVHTHRGQQWLIKPLSEGQCEVYESSEAGSTTRLVKAATPALAICRAALLTVNGEDEKEWLGVGQQPAIIYKQPPADK